LQSAIKQEICNAGTHARSYHRDTRTHQIRSDQIIVFYRLD